MHSIDSSHAFTKECPLRMGLETKIVIVEIEVPGAVGFFLNKV